LEDWSAEVGVRCSRKRTYGAAVEKVNKFLECDTWVQTSAAAGCVRAWIDGKLCCITCTYGEF